MRNWKAMRGYRIISFLLAFILAGTAPVISTDAEEQTEYYEESLAELNNPERGFYQPVKIKMQVSGNEVKNPKDNLIHLRVGISPFSGKANKTGDIPFTQDMLDALDGTLKNIKKNGGSVILRFAYDDFDGIADMEPSMDMILTHIRQLQSIFEENADVITYVELGFFGPWGEMHTSSMCTTENVSLALDAMLDAVPESITIGVRTPKYYAAWANVERDKLDLDMPIEGSDAYRVGLYNDGYLGSESDLGTFANREVEVAWLNNQACHTFYGGEVVADYAKGDALNTAAYLAIEGFKTHTTYLNRLWNNTVIDSWMDEIYQGEDARYQGQSGYTYVANHLGYRFVLRQCRLSEQIYKGQNLNLSIDIENVGFANLINEKKVSLILQGEKAVYELATDIDATKWNSKEVTTLQKEIALPEEMEAGEYSVLLRISKYGNSVSDNNYQCIQLANDEIWDEELGANKLGNIQVLKQTNPQEDKKPEQDGSAGTEDKPGEPEGDTQQKEEQGPDQPEGDNPQKEEEGPDQPEGDNPQKEEEGPDQPEGDTQQKEEESPGKPEGDTQTKEEEIPDKSEESPQNQDQEDKISVKKIKLSGISQKIAGGKKIQLKATVTPENASNKKLIWTSSNKKYATVNQNGFVKLKKAGAGHGVTIKVTAADGSKVTANYKIQIMKNAVQKLTIKASKKEVKVGEKVKIKATISPAKNVNGKLQYVSSNTKYATVDSKGVVRTRKEGKGKTVKITVKTTDGSNLKKTVRIKIK